MSIKQAGRAWAVSLVAILFLLLPFAAFAEGKAEAVDIKAAFAGTCGACHGGQATYPVLGVRTAFNESGHYKGFHGEKNSYYANGAGCQRCHTNEGFIEWVETGLSPSDAYVANPSQPGCFTCHTPHETFDFALRSTAVVTLANGVKYDAGDSNLCAACHMARRDASTTVKAMPAASVSSHFGAHHGPQTDLLAGTNAYEFAGKSYSSSVHMTATKNGCIDCHMALPKGRYSASPELGGHSFRIVGEVHGAEKVNVSACVNCHKDIGQVAGTDFYDKEAEDDYDLDGTVEALQEEVEGLLHMFVNAEGTGLLQTLDPPMYKADGSWNTVREGDRTLEQVAAVYNYKMVEEDRSKGIHNSTYVVQILYDTIQGLDPSFDAAKRPK